MENETQVKNPALLDVISVEVGASQGQLRRKRLITRTGLHETAASLA